MSVYEQPYFDFGDISTGNITVGSGNSGGTTTVGDVHVGHEVDFGGGVALAQTAVPCEPPPPSPYLPPVDFGNISIGNITVGSGNSGGTTTVGDVHIGHEVDFGSMYG